MIHGTGPNRPPISPEEGGLADTRPKTWLRRTLHKLKNVPLAVTDYFREVGILDPKPLLAREVAKARVERSMIYAGADGDSHLTQLSPNQQVRAQQFMNMGACDFALWCVDNNQPLPDDFLESELLPTLINEWADAAHLSTRQASELAASLTEILSIDGMQNSVDCSPQESPEILIDYEGRASSQLSSPQGLPMPLREKITLLKSFGNQLQAAPGSAKVKTLLNTLNQYHQSLHKKKDSIDSQYRSMETLAAFLIKGYTKLPQLPPKQLAACAHFDQLLPKSMSPQKRQKHIRHLTDFMQKNPGIVIGNEAWGIAARYMYDVELKDLSMTAQQRKKLPPTMPSSR